MKDNNKNQAHYKASKTEKFVNPYHFVSLEKNCTREIKEYEERKGNLTGWINCRIETLSPVFIPNTGSASEVDGKKHSDVFGKRVLKDGKQVVINSYDFFSYTDLSTLKGDALKECREPVIPGSEIRGMIRSAFEAVTNSCLSTIDDEQVLYKRVTKNGTPGRLIHEEGRWKIQPCERLGIAIQRTHEDQQDFSKKIEKLKIEDRHEVFIKRGGIYHTKRRFPAFTVVADIKDVYDPAYEIGYFHKGERFGNRKHHESVFILTDETNIEIDESAVKNYIENLRYYKNKNVNLHFKKDKKEHTGYEHIDIKDKELKDFDGSLIYYKKHNDKYYLSPAAIGREVFYNKLTDIIGDYKPCQCLEQLCPACALFGIAGKESAASRVRFTDAFVTGKRSKMEEYYHEVRILKELAGPKLSATEFYLKKNPGNADLWNYDYAVNWGTHKNGIPGYEPKIRGRKFYWHHTEPDPYIPKDKEDDPDFVSDRNVAVRPLKEKVSFAFKVYFNDITGSELKRLLWVLTIGNKKENAHKIGMGKPIGLGSVQVTVEGINLRIISMTGETIEYTVEDRLEQYKNFSAMTDKELGCSPEVMGEFLMLTRKENTFSKIIAYPSNVGEEENYRWFMENKKIKGTGTNPIIENPLPPVKCPELPKYELTKTDE